MRDRPSLAEDTTATLDGLMEVLFTLHQHEPDWRSPNLGDWHAVMHGIGRRMEHLEVLQTRD